MELFNIHFVAMLPFRLVQIRLHSEIDQTQIT